LLSLLQDCDSRQRFKVPIGFMKFPSPYYLSSSAFSTFPPFASAESLGFCRASSRGAVWARQYRLFLGSEVDSDFPVAFFFSPSPALCLSVLFFPRPLTVCPSFSYELTIFSSHGLIPLIHLLCANRLLIPSVHPFPFLGRKKL